MNRTAIRRSLVVRVATVAGAAVLATSLPAVVAGSPSSSIGASSSKKSDDRARPVRVDIVSPSTGDNAGAGGAGWFIDLDLEYPGGASGLKSTGFTGSQLTGPATHNNAAPFPGSFSTGRDDRLPGLVVLTSTTSATLPGFAGPGTNLANLFNLTGITNRTPLETEVWDTWIVGAPIAGKDVDTTVTVAVVDDLDHNGVYDDAPNVVPDANVDGVVDKKDLKALGVVSNVETVSFRLNGAGL